MYILSNFILYAEYIKPLSVCTSCDPTHYGRLSNFICASRVRSIVLQVFLKMLLYM